MIVELFKHNLLWTEGISVLGVLAMLALISWWFYPRFLYLIFGLLLLSVYFFRNPERTCPEAMRNDAVLISPADGKVIDIQYDSSGRFDGYVQKVSIFLSPLDAHVNWTPMAGTVERVKYKQGRFMMAFLPKSSEFNERNDLVIKNKQVKSLIVRQIDGTVARRICCWVKPGDKLNVGQKYGMIRFGSRVDVLLPVDVALNVGIGQNVYGGQTVLGRWSA